MPMKSILFWSMLPLLLPQALYVRQTAPRIDAAAGATTGTVGQGQQKRLLAIGDSIVAGVGAAQLTEALVGQTAMALATSLRCQLDWQALGVSGFDSGKVVAQLLPKLPAEEFDFIIVSVGVNDVTGLTTLRQWRRNVVVLHDALRAQSPDAVIAFSGLPPLHGFPLLPQPLRAVFGMRSQSLDHALAECIGDLRRCKHVPIDFDPKNGKFADDGYHPSEDGYVEFGARMAEELIA